LVAASGKGSRGNKDNHCRARAYGGLNLVVVFLPRWKIALVEEDFVAAVSQCQYDWLDLVTMFRGV
jgi:hypothetical protein